jgi:Lon protease-like protein
MDCSEDCPRPTLPDEMPVMVLPDCHLFPGCLLPLYIYEERYRQMLAHALDSNRMFCIGNREGEDEEAPISPHSTAGLVRACVRQKDGTSHLLLLGLQRIKLGNWVQTNPFRVARIEPLETVMGDPDEQQRLKKEALGLFSAASEQAKELRKVLEENDDAEMVCDVLSYHFTRCPKLQQRLMGEPSLVKRYEMVIKALKKSNCP